LLWHYARLNATICSILFALSTNMPSPRLDRLSALLQGLSPRVSLNEQPQGLALHILVDRNSSVFEHSLDNMALLVCPPLPCENKWSQIPPHQKKWLSFDVALDGPIAPIFLKEFVSPLHINLKHAEASLAQIVYLIASEMTATRCGQPLLINRAGDILLIGLLRHLVAQPQSATGLFTALANPRIAKTLVAMHEDVSKNWSLEVLADQAGMSRTSFAHQFKSLMKITPGKYLENIRLTLAHRLINDGAGLKKVASATGYASASTLSRAMGRLSECQHEA
jgi:AraC-like DNA-binding protein